MEKKAAPFPAMSHLAAAPDTGLLNCQLGRIHNDECGKRKLVSLLFEEAKRVFAIIVEARLKFYKID